MTWFNLSSLCTYLYEWYKFSKLVPESSSSGGFRTPRLHLGLDCFFGWRAPLFRRRGCRRLKRIAKTMVAGDRGSQMGTDTTVSMSHCIDEQTHKQTILNNQCTIFQMQLCICRTYATFSRSSFHLLSILELATEHIFVWSFAWSGDLYLSGNVVTAFEVSHDLAIWISWKGKPMTFGHVEAELVPGHFGSCVLDAPLGSQNYHHYKQPLWSKV